MAKLRGVSLNGKNTVFQKIRTGYQKRLKNSYKLSKKFILHFTY